MSWNPLDAHLIEYPGEPARWATDFGYPELSSAVVYAMDEMPAKEKERAGQAFHEGLEDYLEPIFHTRLTFDLDSIVIRKSQFDKWIRRA